MTCVILNHLASCHCFEVLETYMKGQGNRSRLGRRSRAADPPGLRGIIRKLLAANLSTVTADDDAALAAVRDEAGLTELVAALANANGAREIRAALAAA